MLPHLLLCRNYISLRHKSKLSNKKIPQHLPGKRHSLLLEFAAAISRQATGPREQFLQGFLFRKWPQGFHLLHHISEIMVWLQAVQHGCFCNAVYGRAAMRTTDALCKQPVPPACHKVFQRPFCRQVIDTQMAILQVSLQICFLVQGVQDRFPDQRRPVYGIFIIH